jgi:hypothetical protein
MRLYHYLSYEHGLSAISSNRLKIALLLEMNDPFEQNALFFTDPKAQEKFSAFRKSYNEGTGHICLSRTWSSTIMWSHYADNHRGMVLGFDIPDEYHIQIPYKPGRIDGEPIVKNILDQDSVSPENLKKLMTKHTDWSYEQEHKMTCFLKDAELKLLAGRKMYFEPFDETLTLREVLLGHQAKLNNDLLSQALVLGTHDIKPIRTKLAEKTFGVERA